MLPSIFGENLFDEFFDDAFDRRLWNGSNALYGKHARNLMKTDVQENESGYTLSIDLPGFKKDEVNVELKDGYLTVSAQKGLDKDETDKQGRYIRRERYAGSCSRSFYVGDLKPEDIRGKFESGVLTLSMPKQSPALPQQPNRIAIE
ncbi:heat-shock protein Hsp20 [Gemmiger sp. An120]|uniref:Hsp20/alpha crystallin family protein n=1 Tax=Gemmiger TaxID=204475 RepID=UPI000B381E85|nr:MULTISPECIES: Hsp20/alpha crystallin family protein [Gemmiger]MBM6915169.1 Hsp20/alpha crystallin family protein [Gemmiger formicilis]OUQ41384.1 heat-shock protein Hsp20 [Gemmiger sp. An120]HIX34465.1 Hsp20/alpha crystallin family protein [Candidatus Gemmiger avium]